MNSLTDNVERAEQMRTLRMHGFVSATREGSTVRYALARPRLKQLVEYLQGRPD